MATRLTHDVGHNDYTSRTLTRTVHIERPPSRARVVWAALLGLVAGTAFGAGAMNAERARTAELYERKAEEARQLKSEVIELRTENVILRSQQRGPRD